MREGTLSRTSIVALITLGLLVGGMVGVSFAATTGVVYKFTQTGESYGTVHICNEAQVNVSSGTVSNAGIVRARTASYCMNAKTLNVGYLGVSVNGYRDGSFCGSVGPRYTGTSTSAMVVSSAICSNPSGTQTFRTTMWGYLYKPSIGNYRGANQGSPNQNA